jgi:tetratricopeptide (TPR) repeat protein
MTRAMAGDDFERYKGALKAGHVALLRGQLPEALAMYERAATIAPERPLPYASQGRVLLRMGRTDDALAAYARALGRASRDEAALTGRAEALLAADRGREAGEMLERLAEVQVDTDRVPEGIATLRRAMELHETRRRKRRLRALSKLIGEEAEAKAKTPSSPDAVVTGSRTESSQRVQKGAAEATDPASPGGVIEDTEGPAVAEVEGTEAVAPTASATGEEAPPEESPSVEPAPAHGQDAAHEGGAVPGAAPADPVALEGQAELALAYGHLSEAIAGYLAVASARAARGEPDAALEACHAALVLAPDDPAIHLALTRQYLDHGWRELAAQKLALLETLARLDPQVLQADARRAVEALRVEAGSPAGSVTEPAD